MGQVDPAAALQALWCAELRVDVEVAAQRPDGPWGARSWQGRHRGWVAALSTAEGEGYRLAWLPEQQWPGELDRVAGLAVAGGFRQHARGPGLPGLPDRLELPAELVTGSGAARRRGRADLVAELGKRHADAVLMDGGTPGSDALAAVLAALHERTVARLRAWVRRPGVAAVGRIDWLHHGVCWRRVTGEVRAGRRWVCLDRVAGLRLAPEVARLAARLPAPRRAEHADA